MKADRQAPIGVFDSGVGGLTVVREIMRNLPDERIVYFGDTARVPYGSKSKNTVIRYSRQIVHFLETQQVKAIVIACNTASALALDTIEKEIDLPIIGVVKPGAQMAVETTQNKRAASSQPRALFRAASTSSSLPSRSGDHRLRKTVSAVCAARGRGLDKRSDHRGSGAPLSGRDSGIKDIDTLIMGCTQLSAAAFSAAESSRRKSNTRQPGIRNLTGTAQTAAGAGSGESGKR